LNHFTVPLAIRILLLHAAREIAAARLSHVKIESCSR